MFDTQARPWIQTGKASADEVLATVARCATGALQASHEDGRAAEVKRDLELPDPAKADAIAAASAAAARIAAQLQRHKR